MITRDIDVSGHSDTIKELASRAYAAVAVNGMPRPLAEVALLVAYCNVAEGVLAYPESSRAARAGLLVSLMSRAICEAIESVGRMSDQEVLAAHAVARTCQN